MAKLVYSAICSLDGYVADRDGKFDWAAPDEEVHAAVNEAEKPIGTFLLGRRMYEVLSVWETMDTGPSEPAAIRDYAEIWRSAEKVVYSRALENAASSKTRIEREFEPEAVREMKASADRDLSVGGPGLAAEALRAGLVDELQLFLNPILIGGGLPALPPDLRIELELLAERSFRNGVVYLQHRVLSGG
jgi:dihydrofolate reductase